MSNITLKTYKQYLINLKDNVFKILPLYEEDNPHIEEYLDSIIFELIGFKHIISELPHDHWYGRTIAILKAFESHSFTSKDKKKIKKEIFRILNAIDKQIDELITLEKKGD